MEMGEVIFSGEPGERKGSWAREGDEFRRSCPLGCSTEFGGVKCLTGELRLYCGEP